MSATKKWVIRCFQLIGLYIVVCSSIFVYLESSSLTFNLKAPDGVLAEFPPPCLNTTEHAPSAKCPVLGGGFFFGLATAPAHVEDQLHDSWLDFARSEAQPVRAWHNVALPEERLRFWSEPEVELQLAERTGVSAFRLGVDWGRLVPQEPPAGSPPTLDRRAAQRYRAIMEQARARGLRVMLTLFHHSMPTWAIANGGWTNEATVGHFVAFVKLSQEEFGDLVDWWCTFNEPTIFVILSHCSGAWPPGRRPTALGSALCMTPYGAFGVAMAAVARAHNEAYDVLKAGGSAPVGVAHNVGWLRAYGVLDVPLVLASNRLMLFAWTDAIVDHLDFCGLNYYGQEWISMAGLQLVDSEEYSEAGRAVYPDGLYRLLHTFHGRYKARHPQLRYIVTENGMADDRDLIRQPYILEHLLALHTAMKEGVPVDGYFHWTISDNWEWADGYCPKFGLVHVDRAKNLTRTPRPSYHLFSEVVKSRQVMRKQRDECWQALQEEASRGGTRPFCREVDKSGRMWSGSLDAPRQRHIATKDWRFGSFETPTLSVSAIRTAQVAWTMIFDAFSIVTGISGEDRAIDTQPAEKMTGAQEL